MVEEMVGKNGWKMVVKLLEMVETGKKW